MTAAHEVKSNEKTNQHRERVYNKISYIAFLRVDEYYIMLTILF